MNDPVLIPVYTSLITASVAIVGIILNYLISTKMLIRQKAYDKAFEDDRILRDRGEELYSLAAKWMRNIDQMYLQMTGVMAGQMKINDHYEMVASSAKDMKLEFERIEMIVSVYFNGICPEYEAVLAARKNANSVMLKYQEELRSGTDNGKAIIGKFLSLQEEFDKSQKDFLTSIKNQIPGKPKVGR